MAYTAHEYYKKTGKIPTLKELNEFNEALDRGRAANAVASSASKIKNPYFTGVKNASLNNNNPAYMGGFATANIGGKQLQVLNPLAQQLNFQAAVNQGRWGLNELQPFRVAEEAQKNNQFIDVNQMKSQLDVMNKRYKNATDPTKAGNDWATKLMRSRNKAKELENINKQMQRGGNEIVTARGQQIGGNYNSEDLMRRQRQAQRELQYINSSGPRHGRTARGGYNVHAMTDEFARMRPTVANVPIFENVHNKRIK